MDLFPILAGIVGGKIPGDRVIDDVDQLDFLTGKLLVVIFFLLIKRICDERPTIMC